MTETLNLSSRAQKCIDLAIRDGRLGSAGQLPGMSDLEIRWGVRGRGQAHGIGVKTLKEIRAVYPKI